MGFDILDGIISHVYAADETFGKEDSADPLLAPFEPLQIETHWKKPSHNGDTYLESTLNIAVTTGSGTTFPEAVSFKDTITATAAKILAPKVKIAKLQIKFDYSIGVSESHDTIVYQSSSDSGLDTGQKTLIDHIGIMRSLVLEQSIVNQVHIPRTYVGLYFIFLS